MRWTKETSWQDVLSVGHQRERPWEDMPPQRGSSGTRGFVWTSRSKNAGLVEGHTCADLRRVAPDEGNRLGMHESRQVDKLQMDAGKRMNSLEGVDETASSPQLKRAPLEAPLDGEQEKTGKDETELTSLEDAPTMKSRGSPSSSTESSLLDKTSTRSRDVISSTFRGKCSLAPRSGTCSTSRVGEELSVTQLVNNPREVGGPLLFATPSREFQEPLFFETTSPGPCEGSRRNSVINMGPIRSPVH